MKDIFRVRNKYDLSFQQFDNLTNIHCKCPYLINVGG